MPDRGRTRDAWHVSAAPRIERVEVSTMRLALAVAVVSMAAFGAGCGGGSGYGGSGGTKPATCTAEGATATTSVSLSGMEFVPSCIKVSQGATVTFQDADMVQHTVTTDPGQPETFDSGPLSTGQNFVHTFANAAETVHVHCSFHANMHATIIVQ